MESITDFSAEKFRLLTEIDLPLTGWIHVNPYLFKQPIYIVLHCNELQERAILQYVITHKISSNLTAGLKFYIKTILANIKNFTIIHVVPMVLYDKCTNQAE